MERRLPQWSQPHIGVISLQTYSQLPLKRYLDSISQRGERPTRVRLKVETEMTLHLDSISHCPARAANLLSLRTSHLPWCLRWACHHSWAGTLPSVKMALLSFLLPNQHSCGAVPLPPGSRWPWRPPSVGSGCYITTTIVAHRNAGVANCDDGVVKSLVACRG